MVISTLQSENRAKYIDRRSFFDHVMEFLSEKDG